MNEPLREAIGLVARSLVQGVTDEGRRDLSAMRLTEMEGEVYGLLDLVGEQMLQALLERQAAQVEEVEQCPACGEALEAKPPQAKTLQLKRGKVHWREPVLRCGRCRRDFFPSGEGARL